MCYAAFRYIVYFIKLSDTINCFFIVDGKVKKGYNKKGLPGKSKSDLFYIRVSLFRIFRRKACRWPGTRRRAQPAERVPEMDKRLERIRLWMVMLRRLCLLLCAAVTVAVTVLNIEEITADNMRRVLAKLDVTFERGVPLAGYISYPESRDNHFALFKGGLAVLTPERLRIYDAAGVRFLDREISCGAPAVDACRRFVLTYDRGGTRLNVYNSFACVFSTVYEGGILSARINDAGYLSVLTRATGYNALLTVYDTSFREIYKRWYSEGRFAAACDVSPDGERAFAVILKASLEGFKAELEILKLAEETPCATVDIGGEFPFDARFLTNDRIVIAGDGSCRFYDGQGAFLSSAVLEGKLLCLWAKDGRVALGCDQDEGGRSVLRLLNADGRQIFKRQQEGTVKSVCAAGDYVAGLTDDLLVIAFTDGTVRELSVARKHRAVLAASARHVLLVSDDRAEYIEVRE